jgi:hypothetical protein
VEAAARALAGLAPGEGDLRRAEAAVHAADGAGYGVVPREEYESLALDYSAMRVRALQDEDLLQRALEALDRIGGSGESVATDLRALAFGVAVEVRALLDARSDDKEDEAR